VIHHLPAALLLAISTSAAQQLPTIRVPVRLVSVPTLVVSKEGKYLPGLSVTDFALTDNNRPRTVKLDADSLPISIVVAVQANEDVRDYLPFIARVGSLLDDSLAAATGEAALITYNDEVTLAKPFRTGDLEAALQKISPSGSGIRMIDAGLRAIELLKECRYRGSRVLLFIGQPVETSSDGKIDLLEAEAERENVQIYALTLPLFGKAFASDAFRLEGLGSQWYKGGYQASIEPEEPFQRCGEPDKQAIVAILSPY
jgi:hypothetical protein